MAMLLPVVFVLGDPAGAIIMFAGIFYGAMYGGATTAILLNTPGESNAVVTALNGYRMAKAGRAGAALLASALGSFMASILATFALAFVAEPLAAIALTLGPPEFVAFVMLALSSAAVLGGRPLKAAFSTLFGLAVGTVGINITTGVSRFDLGQLVLKGGIDFELVSIGMFAVVEVLFVVGTLRLSGRTRRIGVIGKLYMTVEEWRRSILPWLRGSALGFLVGVLPGAGDDDGELHLLRHGALPQQDPREVRQGPGHDRGASPAPRRPAMRRPSARSPRCWPSASPAPPRPQ